MKQKYLNIVLIMSLSSQLFCQSYFYSLNNSEISAATTIARIDSIQITAEEFFYNYEFGPAFTKRSENSKSAHLDFMINEKLLALQGIDENIYEDKEINSMLNDIKADIATEELFKDSIMSKVKYTQSEIERMMEDKNTEIELLWLFEKDKKKLFNDYEKLLTGAPFDSLWNLQLNDTIFSDERSMKTNFFQLRQKNPQLAEICDTLNTLRISKPINVNGDWYIIKVKNIYRNLTISELDMMKKKRESVEALTKNKMDSISDGYINELMSSNKPVIQRYAFNIVRSYIAKYRLKNENYNKWQMDDKLLNALEHYGLSKSSNMVPITLVKLKDTEILIDDFLNWFRNRNLYIKLPETKLNDFSASIENLIWLMVRDKLLTRVAERNNYFENNWVKKQNDWWKHKLAYSAYRNKLAQSILIDNNEVVGNSEDEKKNIEHEMRVKMFRKIVELRKKYDVNIDYEALSKIKVSDENDKSAINFYAAKNKGLIPRPPYPSIDNDWNSWK